MPKKQEQEEEGVEVMQILKLEQRHEGAIGGRGKFKGYLPENEKGEIKKMELMNINIWTGTNI